MADRNRTWITGWLGVLALLLVSSVSSVQAMSTEAARPPMESNGERLTAMPGLKVLRSDASGLELLLRVAEPALEPVVTPVGVYTRVSLSGYAALAEPGRPALPERGLLLAVPPDAMPSVQILHADWQALSQPVVPLPAASWHLAAWPAAPSSASPGLERSLVADPQIYSQGDYWPANAVTLGKPAWLRHQRVVRLAVRPVRWQPTSRELQVARTLHIRVAFSRPQNGLPAATDATMAEDPFFEGVLRAALLNYEQARAWRSPAMARPTHPLAPAWSPAPDQPWWKVGVKEDGLYALTAADLAAAGLESDQVDPRYLQLWDEGQQIALIFQGDESDGTFDDNDRILWWGQRSRTRYTDENIYWLTIANEPGLRATTIDGTPTSAPVVGSYPATTHLEINKVYISDAPRRDGIDHWYGQRLIAGVEPTRTIQITVDEWAGGPAQLTIRMVGVSLQGGVDPDHHVRVYFDGQPVGDLLWDGRELVTDTIELDEHLLAGIQHVVRLEAPGDTGASADVSYLDWLELRYQRRFVLPPQGLLWEDETAGARTYHISGLSQSQVLALDVTNPWVPQILSGVQVISGSGNNWLVRFSRTGEARRHLVVTPNQIHTPSRIERAIPADWSFVNTGADYLAISHRAFITAVQPLLDWRQAQGMRTALVDVQQIYDAYSDGQMDPQAIRRFLEDAYYTWPRPAPAFVLLVGNGHYDFQNFLGYAQPRQVYLPPLLGCWDPWLCEVASDNRYVTLEGDDELPDMFIGRLPVRSVEQANVVVSKILAYEQSPPSGDWQRRAIFVSDNTYDAQGRHDPAGDFEHLSEQAIALLPADFSPVRVYYDPYPTDDAGEPFRYRTPQATTAALIAATSQGAAFLNFVGHAGPNVWAHEWLLVARGRQRDDLPQLVNGPRLPVGLSMACLSGNFADPTYHSLDAELLMLDVGGTVASWGATGFGVATGHDWLHQGFYDAIFRQGQTRLGIATTVSKLDLYAGTASHHDLIDTFVLLGDPATNWLLSPDLRLAQVPPTEPLGPGDSLAYRVQIDNLGGLPSPPGLRLALELPPLNELTISSSGAAVSPTVEPGEWLLAELPPQSSTVLTVSGQLPFDISADALPLQVRARLVDAWADRDWTDNKTPAAAIPLLPADLNLSWQAQPALIGPGSTVTATLLYRNRGPAATVSTRFTLTLPTDLIDVQVNGPGLPPTPPAGATLSWSQPPLAPGSGQTVVIRGTVAPTAVGPTLTFTAQGSHPWPDADPEDNQATLELPFAAPDVYEPDDSPEQATPLVVPGRSDGHTLHRINDRDWFSFYAHKGRLYRIRIEDLSEGADSVLSLFDANLSLQAKNDDYTLGSRWSGLDWIAPADGLYYLLVTGWSDSPLGFSYDLSIGVLYRLLFPLGGVAR